MHAYRSVAQSISDMRSIGSVNQRQSAITLPNTINVTRFVEHNSYHQDYKAEVGSRV